MTRLNVVMLVLLVICALGLVTSQQRARKLYTAHEKASVETRELDTAYKLLELEQSALTKASLIDAKAKKSLAMQASSADKVIHVNTSGADQAALGKAR
jgi:cell division protein FtsL